MIITVVPEKEELVILAERSAAPAIREAIEKLPCLTTPCLTTPGIGIKSETPISKFVTLGENARKPGISAKGPLCKFIPLGIYG